jgi:phage FluMu protein Com
MPFNLTVAPFRREAGALGDTAGTPSGETLSERVFSQALCYSGGGDVSPSIRRRYARGAKNHGLHAGDPMPIEFRCTKCGKLLRTPDETAGKQARCPECGTIVPIPAATAAPTAPAPTSIPSPPPGYGAAPPSYPVGSAPAAARANPYQSPTVSTPATSPAPPPSFGKLDFGDAMSRAWAIFTKNIGRCIGIVLLFWVLYMVLFLALGVGVGAAFLIVRPAPGGNAGALAGGIIALFVVVYIAAMLVNVYLMTGQTNFFLKVARGDQNASVSLLFSGSRWFLSVLGGGILAMLAVGVGWVFCFVPGIIVGLMLSQFLFLIIDRDKGAFEAFRESRRITSGNKGHLFLALFIPSMILWVVMFVPSLALQSLAQDHPGLMVALQILLQMVVTVLFTPWLWVLWATCYLIMSGQPTADRAAPTSPAMPGPGYQPPL